MVTVDNLWPAWEQSSRINPSCLLWYVETAITENRIITWSRRNVLAATTDIFITSILIYYLVRQLFFYADEWVPSPDPSSFYQLKRRSGHAASDKLLSKVAQCTCHLAVYSLSPFSVCFRCSDISQRGHHRRLGSGIHHCICEFSF
jgi:hypothetical protein